MSGSRWVEDNRDMSPDRNNHYQLDNLGLQLGLGLPLQFMGVSLVGNIHNRITTRPNGGRRQQRNMSNGNHGQGGSVCDIQQTVDGIPVRKVYVTNINIEVQRQEMYTIFGPYGQIMNIFIGVSKNDNLKQFAFITFADPKDAAKVLNRRKFQDARGRAIYVSAADSWHQPKEGPNGQIIWKVDRRAQAKEEEESEEDDEQAVSTEAAEVQAVEDSQEGLNALNDDCLMHIFSFLSYKEIIGVERVCKRWQALSFRMWRCLHELSLGKPPFNKLMEYTTPTLEQYLRRCGEALTVLDIATERRYAFNETTIAVIAKYCSNLEVLRIANIIIGNRSLAHLGRRCPKLKQLLLDSCDKFNDNDLMSLLPKCPELSHLNLKRANGIVGRFLVNIEGPITSLKLCKCPAIEPNHLIDGLKRMSKTLQNLKLSACESLCSSEVNRIVSAVPNLTSLSLCRCFPQFDIKSLCPIGQLTKLTTLNLSMNNAVNDTALASIVDGCDQLHTVNISGSGGGCAIVLSDQGVSMLGRLRKLTDLDISYLEAANNVALKNLSTRLPQIKRLVCRGCPFLSDDGSVQVVTVCNDLELFDLSGCNSVSEETVSAASTSVKMRTNSVPLKLIVGGTNVDESDLTSDKEVPLLTVELTDYSEEHLRPDFIDDMFFPPSDSEEEDLEHLCERIGCDSDFEIDDMFDPTLRDLQNDLYDSS